MACFASFTRKVNHSFPLLVDGFSFTSYIERRWGYTGYLSIDVSPVNVSRFDQEMST